MQQHHHQVQDLKSKGKTWTTTQDHLAQERVKVAAPDFLPCHNMEKGRAHIGGSAELKFEKMIQKK